MRRRYLVYLVLPSLIAAPLWSQAREHDPLNEKEVDQLREAAMEPEKRLKLMVDFTRARMTSLEQLRTDAKAGKDRGQKTHDLLEDIADLIDEIDDNVDDYNERSADLRKPLKDIVQMESDFQGKLKELRTAAQDPKNAEASDYTFALQDATDSVNKSAESSRKLLDEQNVKFANAKKKK